MKKIKCYAGSQSCRKRFLYLFLLFGLGSIQVVAQIGCPEIIFFTPTSCVDNGNDTYTANYNLAFSWSNPPAGEMINVIKIGTIVQTIPASNTSPDTVSLSLEADGLGKDTIIVEFTMTANCADTLIIKSPNACPTVIGGCVNRDTLALGPPTVAQELANGTTTTESRLDLVETSGGTTQTIGIHYNDVRIPAGATITSASIQFKTLLTDNNSPISIIIKGEDSNDADTFATSNFNLTTRAMTMDSVVWSPPDWPTPNEMGANQQTPDLSSIIQAIINRPGWNAYQNLVFILKGNGRRSAYPQAVLNVTYQATGACEPAAICNTIANDEIRGSVWNDYNFDGVINELDPEGIEGIKVHLYNCEGHLIDSTFTNNKGTYSFSGISSVDYRIEFSLPESVACWAKPTHQGTNSGTTVQFVQAGDCASLGIANPANYCQEDPLIGLSCFSEGQSSGAYAGEPGIIHFPSSADGHDFTGTTKTVNYKGVVLDSIGAVGAAYGLAWQSTTQRMYLGAYHKRFSGFGPAGPDAIYQYDLAGNKTGTIELDNLLGSTNTAGADVHDFVTTNNGEIMDLGTGNASFDGVGKRAFGDVEISSDMTTLYTVNLFDRKIYAIDITDGNTTNASVINSWDAPDPLGTGTHRPFALDWHQGKLWIGLVTEDAANAYVYSLAITGTNFNLELTIPLNYDRQSVTNGNANATTIEADWYAWTSDPETTAYDSEAVLDISYPQPMLSDIEFDGEAMILGFRDRFGDQAGSESFFNNTDAGNNKYTWASTGGEILRACYNGFNFVLETGNDGNCPGVSGLDSSGPGGPEYYHWDYYHISSTWNPLNANGGFHWETTQGGLLQLPNQSAVFTTAMNPFDDYSGGILKLNNETGRREGITATDIEQQSNLVGGYTIYELGDYGATPPTNNNGTYGKANGLGDLEAFCNNAPLEIGNYVWCDSIENGIQDACEKGLDSLIIQLYDRNGLLVGQDTTINGGQYYFNQHNVDTTGINPDGSPMTSWSGLNYNSQYFIVFGGNQFTANQFLVGGKYYRITDSLNVNANSKDQIDSDVDKNNLTTGSLGSRPNNLPFIALTTDAQGCGNHQYDVGLTCRYDYGDLPDVADGTTGITDYETYDSTGGPSHLIVAGLFLGDTIDMDNDGFPNAQALGDDNDGADDEDGLYLLTSMNLNPGATIRIPLKVSNTTGDTAYIESWIDWNGDGDFDEPNELIADLKDNKDGVFPAFLEITAPVNALTGSLLGFRIRLSNTDNMTPYGAIGSGEVEDYLISVDCKMPICLPINTAVIRQE